MALRKEISRSTKGDRIPTKRAQSSLPNGMAQRRHSTRLQIQDVVEGFNSSSETLCQFAVQLLLSPSVTVVNFVKSLPFLDHEVEINMFVADLDGDDRVAYDVISERPLWDIDHEGLVQLALEQHRIRLVEIDQANIAAEPLASNCERIWSYRDYPVPPPLEAAIDRALTTHQRLTVRSLARMIGLRDAAAVISALHCHGVVLVTDLSVPLGPDSVVCRACDRLHLHTLSAGRSKRSRKDTQ